MTAEKITSLIPHRPPFLWVDSIVSISADVIETEITIAEDLDVFTGHYPGNPIMPGVLLCEAIFQSGALLLSKALQQPGDRQKIPVLIKIINARFKRRVLPGETLAIRVKLVEAISSVFILKGSARVAGELAVKTEFSCALTDA